ncbi:MAG: hypothetical protein ACI9EF_000321 [Pseudohongiellaceae bacterium]|jgi:uncharacterized protein YebE (UPF0316 family)
MGTVRTILVIRGHKLAAAVIGFFEILIWLLAASQVLQQLDKWYLAVAYAGGFALGNITGMWLEGRLALGVELVRAISRSGDVNLAAELRSHGYSITQMTGMSDTDQPVEVLLVVESRRRVPELLDVIHEADPDALCTISDVRRYAPRVRPRQTGIGRSKRK